MAAAIRASLGQTERPEDKIVHIDDSDAEELSGSEDDNIEAFSGSEDESASATDVASKSSSVKTESQPTKEPSETKSEPAKVAPEKVVQNGKPGSWEDYLGTEDVEVKSTLLIRFPGGKKEKKEVPASTPFLVSH